MGLGRNSEFVSRHQAGSSEWSDRRAACGNFKTPDESGNYKPEKGHPNLSISSFLLLSDFILLSCQNSLGSFFEANRERCVAICSGVLWTSI